MDEEREGCNFKNLFLFRCLFNQNDILSIAYAMIYGKLRAFDLEFISAFRLCRGCGNERLIHKLGLDLSILWFCTPESESPGVIKTCSKAYGILLGKDFGRCNYFSDF